MVISVWSSDIGGLQFYQFGSFVCTTCRCCSCFCCQGVLLAGHVERNHKNEATAEELLTWRKDSSYGVCSLSPQENQHIDNWKLFKIATSIPVRKTVVASVKVTECLKSESSRVGKTNTLTE